MSEARPGIELPSRFIPVPTSISPEAQAFLSHAPLVGATEMPEIGDVAGWKAHIARSDAQMLPMVKQFAASYPAQWSTQRLDDCPLYEIAPVNADPANARRAILYIHGGGFTMGGGEAAVYPAITFAGLARCKTFSLDYRMPPDHPYPAAIDDGVAAWRRLIARFKPENLAIYGPSAGGNLAPALILKLRDLGLPLPAVCGVHSPAADLTESGDSFETNRIIDIVLREPLPKLMTLYAGGHDFRDPLLSPAFADYAKGFPPTILTTGTRDLLLSSTVMLHRAMRRGGVDARLHVWDAMTHAPFFGSPEEAELMAETVSFMLEQMGSN
jgi:acetyl esterase/lipase